MHTISSHSARQFRRAGLVALATTGLMAAGVAAAGPASATTAAPLTSADVALANEPAQLTLESSRTSFLVPRTAAASKVRGLTQAVASRITRPHLRADRTRIDPEQVVTLIGSVTYGWDKQLVRSQPVRLQVLAQGSWRTISTRELSTAGKAGFTVYPKQTTTYRLAFAGQDGLRASVSAAVTVTVRSYLAGPTATAAVTSSATASGKAAQVLAIAAAQTGKWYEYGAAGPSTFDCSGLTQYVFGKVGVWLPHKANSQLAYGRAVAKSSAAPGDLVFFLSDGYAYHVGIYAGGGYMYDAPRTGQQVGKHKIWSTNIVFRRVV
ncbi:MAG TPA: C40 family peptidase [Micromonosporaceae bacterium]